MRLRLKAQHFVVLSGVLFFVQIFERVGIEAAQLVKARIAHHDKNTVVILLVILLVVLLVVL